jgi:radical SAM superfamily enzyme YgiQ (UPF0313 family)
MFSIATPFPGTEFYQLVKEKGWFAKGGYQPRSVQSKSVINYPSLSNRELDWLIKKANISFYISPRIIRKNFRRILQPKNFFDTLKAFKRKFF